jgi:small acid-soluble spore protein H (minor)
VDIRRAKEIVESHGVIDVLHQNSPVWIEDINDGNLVQVSYLDTKERTSVPVSELQER